MMKKLAHQRVAVLVDAENLEITTRRLHQAAIDYRGLINSINDRQIIRAVYYTRVERIYSEDENGHNKADGFVHFLKEVAGFEIKTAPKNADCWLTVDAISISSKVDVIVLVAADGDYVPLVYYLKSRGVKCEVWSWENKTSRNLKEAADEFVPLDEAVLRFSNA